MPRPFEAAFAALLIFSGWCSAWGCGNLGAVVLVVTLLGATTALLWEIYEWLAENYLFSRIPVGYDDTIGDLANGTLGSLVAGGRWPGGSKPAMA